MADHAIRVELDEYWLAEWCALGWIELIAYLANQAAFALYCEEHPRREPPT